MAEAEARILALTGEKQNRKTPRGRLDRFGLTNRETDTALLLIGGKSRNEIAADLFISLGTVNYHCSNIYRKAGVTGASEFIRLVLADNNLSSEYEKS